VYLSPRSEVQTLCQLHLFQITNKFGSCVISDFRREAEENCAVLSYYTAGSGNFLPTFRGNLSIPSSGLILKMGPVGCPETSVRNYHYCLRNSAEEGKSHTRFLPHGEQTLSPVG